MKKNRFLFIVAFAMFVMLPFNVSAMQIVIQPPERENINLEVESADTIEAVKSKIFNLNNTFIVDEQRLYFNNTELTDGRTLGDYNGLIAGSVIKLEIDEIKIIFKANGGLYSDNTDEYVREDYYSENDMVYPTREGYRFEGYYTEQTGGLTLDYYDYLYKLEDDMIFYAHWEKEGIETLDFTKVGNGLNFSSLEEYIFQFLVDNGILVLDETNNTMYNKNRKALVKLNDESKFVPVEGLTTDDNIEYTLTAEDKQAILNDTDMYEESEIPNIVRVIVVEEKAEEIKQYKVIFDANGGTFENDIKTIDVEDIINFDYDSFKKPTRKEHKFIGFYTKDGKSYLDVMNSETGIEEDTTFYAKWEFDGENPKTFDGIGTSIFMGTISLIGLVSGTIYLKKRNKVRV